jgi:hypothetical protein
LEEYRTSIDRQQNTLEDKTYEKLEEYQSKNIVICGGKFFFVKGSW